jgi:hypothetical protein
MFSLSSVLHFVIYIYIYIYIYRIVSLKLGKRQGPEDEGRGREGWRKVVRAVNGKMWAKAKNALYCCHGSNRSHVTGCAISQT